MTATITRPPSIGMGPKEEARRFFFALYRGGLLAGEWFELRCLDCRTTPSGVGPRLFFRSITELIEQAMKLRDRWDVYYGVGTRRCPDVNQMGKCQHKSRGLDHISRLPGAWVDLDVQSPDEPNKHYPSQLEGLEALYGLPAPPTIIVGSGAGLHAYWPFEKLTKDLDSIVSLNADIAASLSCDNCGDAPRILRIPGTFNHKHGRPLPVTLIEAPDRLSAS